MKTKRQSTIAEVLGIIDPCSPDDLVYVDSGYYDARWFKSRATPMPIDAQVARLRGNPRIAYLSGIADNRTAIEVRFRLADF